MKSDRVSELYHGQIFDQQNQRICRERIHWMCSQVEGQVVLDFGCSQGIASILLGREGRQVVGVDTDASVIEFARAELKKEADFVRRNVRFELIAPGPLEFETGSFDSVLFGEVIEHLTHPRPVLAELKRVCRPGGRVAITTPFGILPHPGHVRTYYLREFIETVGESLSIEDIFLRNKYICCTAVNAAGPPLSGALDAARLLALSEQAFEQIELGYLERWERLKRQYHVRAEEQKKLKSRMLETQAELRQCVRRLEECNAGLAEREREVARLTDSHTCTLTRLQQEREELVATLRRQHAEEVKKIKTLHKQSREARDKRLKTLDAQRLKLEKTQQAQLARVEKAHQTELARLKRELAGARRESQRAAHAVNLMESRLNRQTDQLQYTRASLQLREQEVRYKLGDALVSAYYHPTHLIALPRTMVNLFTEGLRRRRERGGAMQRELAALAPGARRGGGDGAPFPAVRTNGQAAPLLLAGSPPPVSTEEAVASPESASPPSAEESASAAPSQARPRNNGPAIAEPPAPETNGPATPAAAPEARQDSVEVSFAAPVRTNRPPRLPLRAAVVMDDFTYECFRDECNLIRVNPKDWQGIISSDRPDFLFVESTWKGNNGAWSCMVNRPYYQRDEPLPSLVRWCREQNIPTVFWNKEDPPNYDRFIAAAELFDYIFTTDADCVPRYRDDVGHDRIFPLPFAAQPTIHNPIRSRDQRVGPLCFAGTYYQEKYPQRQKDLETLLAPAASRGLTIFDRQHGFSRTEAYRFPERYHPFIRGGLSYMEMVQAYKAYDVFLNINSVRESPTMFSRRVLELLACGTAVISTPSLGIERLLGREAVAIVETEQEAAGWMDRLLSDRDLRERMVLLGQRRVFGEHTYEARLREIIDKIGLLYPAARRRVSVVAVTNRPAYLDRVIENYRRQAYQDKELIVVLNNDGFRLEDVAQRLGDIPNARVFQRPESCTLGECLNFAVDQSEFEFIAKMDDDDFYAEHYLTDMLSAFHYCDTDIVGKRSYYAYLEQSQRLVLRFPEREHRYVALVSGATLVVRRQLFDHQRFPEKVPRGVDTLFQQACADRGFGIYATDRFNFVATRSAPGGHTWQISDQEFMEKCRPIAETPDYRPFVVV